MQYFIAKLWLKAITERNQRSLTIENKNVQIGLKIILDFLMKFTPFKMNR